MISADWSRPAPSRPALSIAANHFFAAREFLKRTTRASSHRTEPRPPRARVVTKRTHRKLENIAKGCRQSRFSSSRTRTTPPPRNEPNSPVSAQCPVTKRTHRDMENREKGCRQSRFSRSRTRTTPPPRNEPNSSASAQCFVTKRTHREMENTEKRFRRLYLGKIARSSRLCRRPEDSARPLPPRASIG